MDIPHAVTAIPGSEVTGVVARNNEDDNDAFYYTSIGLTSDLSADLPIYDLATWARFTVVAPVPEPGTIALLGTGLLGLAGLAGRRRPRRTA